MQKCLVLCSVLECCVVNETAALPFHPLVIALKTLHACQVWFLKREFADLRRDNEQVAFDCTMTPLDISSPVSYIVTVSRAVSTFSFLV